MITLIVFEAPNEGLCNSICEAAGAHYEQISHFGDFRCDIALISPNYCGENVPVQNYKILVIPSQTSIGNTSGYFPKAESNEGNSTANDSRSPENAHTANLLKDVYPKEVITYGMSHSSTLSLSSVNNNGFLVELRRSIVSVSGYRYDECEYPIVTKDNTMAALAKTGVLLAAGAFAPSESICPEITAYSVASKLML